MTRLLRTLIGRYRDGRPIWAMEGGDGTIAPLETRTANLDAVKARAAEINARQSELDALDDWTDEQRTEWEQLAAETDDLEARRTDIEKRAAILERSRSTAHAEPVDVPTIHTRTTTDDVFDLDTLTYSASPEDVRARAITAIERVQGDVPDYARQRATQVVERLPAEVAHRVLVTGSTDYRKAYTKGLLGQAMLWTEGERQAFMRAASLTTTEGGFAIPFLLDPTIISTNDISTNPFRRISRVVTGTSNVWQGISSAGVTASFDAEAAEVSDDAPTLAQPAVTAHMARAFVPASIEIAMDWGAIEADLRAMFQEAKDDLEGTMFTTGSGTAQPFGIITAITGGASVVTAATDDVFAIADVYSVEEALPPKYRLATLDGDTLTSRASWIAHHAIYNLIRQFDTGGGAGLWETLGGGLPPRLLGYPAYEASAMDGVITTTGAVSNDILCIGDFRNFVIYDRVGMSIEFIPHLFATANNLPSGQRGWFGYWRVGADSVNDDAFRLLDVTSAA